MTAARWLLVLSGDTINAQRTAVMIRVIFIALAFLSLTLVLLPFQLIGIAFDLRLRRSIPLLYHRILCALIGVRIREVGRRSKESPALILSNHVWWSQPVDATLYP
jgi:lyso-ornithine lipid O-acyltransferase